MATGRIPTTANSPLTAKGDLFTFSTGSAKLAVGSNGDTLVADSSAATGLSYAENYAAGKNKIINGDFGVWQRGTSFSNPATAAFTSDRWSVVYDGTGATRTISQQTFTPGTAPVAGYEGRFFYRFAQSVAGSGGSYNLFQNRMEDVRTFAGQTVTISFWGKAAATTSIVKLNLEQEFGSGGSPSATVDNDIAGTNFSLTTSWQRFTVTTTVPSITGKTVGTTTPGFLGLRVWIPVNATFTLDFFGFQMEESSVATAFQTATGTLQGELAACQRYFQREADDQKSIGSGAYFTTTLAFIPYFLKTTMRVIPTVTFDGVTAITVYDVGVARLSTAVSTDAISPRVVELTATTGATTAGRGIFARVTTSGNFINFSAEL